MSIFSAYNFNKISFNNTGCPYRLHLHKELGSYFLLAYGILLLVSSPAPASHCSFISFYIVGVKSHLVCCVATVSTAVTHNYIMGLYPELVAQELRSVNY